MKVNYTDRDNPVSRHIEQADGGIEHVEFLDITDKAPVAGFVDAQLKACDKNGAIISQNVPFEAASVAEFTAMFPKKRSRCIHSTNA